MTVVLTAIRMGGHRRAVCATMGFTIMKQYDCTAIVAMSGRHGNVGGNEYGKHHDSQSR